MRRRTAARPRPLLQELEPRILYSADPFSAAVGAFAGDAPLQSEVRLLPAEAPAAAANELFIDIVDAASIQAPRDTAAREIAFIDRGVEGFQALADDLQAQQAQGRRVDIVLLDTDRDGVDQIGEALAGRSGIGAVHLISHGADGRLQLGNTSLDATTLARYATQVAGWNGALATGADLLLYGCDVAADSDGQAFIARLAELSGADVAASRDATGSAVLGGNWSLEAATGAIETGMAIDPAAQSQFGGLLAIVEGTTSSALSRSGNTLAFSHTVPVGANGILIVSASYQGGSNNSVVSITYDGAAMTRLGSVQAAGGANTSTEMWYLKAPAPATANVVVTMNASAIVAGGATSFLGVDQAAPTSAFATGTGNSYTPALTIASAAGELVIDSLGKRSVVSGTVGAGQTEKYQELSGSSGGDVWGSSSTRPGAASVTMRWTISGSGSGEYAMAAVSLRPATPSAPTLIDGSAVTVTGTDENTPSSGTTVESLLASAGWADADAGASKGVAVTSATGRGTWQYSTTGTSWTGFGAVSSTSALLLASTAQVRYLPDTLNGETASFAFKAWDQTSGAASADAAPAYATTAASGGTTAFSSQNASATINVSSVNDAPTGAPAVIGTVTERQTLTADTASIADVDGLGAFAFQWLRDGQAVAGATAATYLLGNGDVAGRMSVRVSYTDAHGTAESLTSAATAPVANVNDAPTLASGASVALNPTDENTASSARAVAGVLTAAGWADVDAGALKGIAVTSLSGNGTWQYSADNGTTWSGFGAVSSSSALLLEANSLVRYDPDRSNGETASFAFKAWDQTSGSASTNAVAAYASPGAGGGTTAFSSQNASVTISVTSVNDAPVLGDARLPSIAVGTSNPPGRSVGALFDAQFADVDAGSKLAGVAVVGNTATPAQGTWQYSSSGGSSWKAIGAVDDANAALVIGRDSLLRFMPASTYTGNPADLVLRALDNSYAGGYSASTATETRVLLSTAAAGGATPIALATSHLGTSVESTTSAPVLTGANALSPIDEDAFGNSGTLVSALIAGRVTSAAPETGIAVTGVDNSHGRWQYSRDGAGSWTDLGTPGPATARLLAADSLTRVRFVPDADWNGTVANGLTFRAWDQTSGTAGGTADTTGRSNTFLDRFETVSYANNDGDARWSSAWVETDSGGAAAGRIYVAPPLLYFDTKGDGESITRQADLTGATSATLALGLSRNELNSSGSIAIQVSGNGGGSFSTLQTITQASGTGTLIYDISAYIAANTQIRLFDSGSGDDKQIAIDEIRIVLAGNSGGGTAYSSAVASAPIVVRAVNDLPSGAPVIVGTAAERQTLAADTSSIADADGLGTFAYQWLRDGVAIGGATASTLVLGNADVGKAISVGVFYTDGHGTPERVTSAATAPVANVNDTPSGAPAVTGTPTENQTLTANASAIADADGVGAFSYQWLRDGFAIVGATGDRLLLGNADVGRAISVVVSYTDGHGTREQLTSAATAPVANVNDAPTGAPVIVGTATEDQTLTVDTSGIGDADGLGAFSYQWLRDGAAIAGATNGSRVLGDADVGRAISVVVSYTDGHGTREQLTSAATAPVANVNDAPTGAPVIAGTATEDQTLTVDTSGIGDVDGLGAFSQQWLRDGVAVAGATGSSLVLGDNDVGRAISVAVSYTDGHGTREQLTSAATAPVANVNDAPTGAPVIAGTATEDQTLTVDTRGIADPDGLGAFSYQWLRDGAAIAGAANGSLVLGDADVGRAISVVVSYTDGQGTREQLTSAARAPVANVNDAPTGAPVIAGTATEDQTLTVDTSGIGDADGLGAFSYQWLRDGGAIAGATNGSLVLGDADVGRAISVMVTYTDGQGTAERLTSAVTAPVANVNDAPTGAPVIAWTVTEDQTLTVDTSGIGDADGLGAFSHQWLRDGVAIAGATGSSLVLGDADVGRAISVMVSYTDGQGTAERLTSAVTAPVANVNDAPTGAPVIVGTATEDQTLTVDTSSVVDADGLGAFSHQWLRDGAAIAGATGSSLVLGDADVGRAISVVVSYTDGHGTREQLTSAVTAPVANVNDAPTGAPVIAGTATEDQTLTVDTSGIVDADGLGAFSYQWLRDGRAIIGATNGSLVLGDADVGRAISVVVSYTDGQGTIEQLTSAATALVANVNDAPTGAPVISGTATEDQTLTVDMSGIGDADGLGAFSYQWLRDGAAIAGATNGSLVLGDADVGRAISVVVSYTDGHGIREQLTSAATALVANVNDAPTGAPVIAGTATEDEMLRVDTSGIVDADGLGAFSYQWLRDGAAIAGATGSSLVLGDADVGRAISVVVSHIDGHGTREQLTSAATAPVANVNDAPTGAPMIAGTATEDQTLRVDTSSVADADGLGAFSYQWLRDGAAIAGATNGSLVLGDADVGRAVSIAVSYTDGHGMREQLTSAATAPVANVNDAPTGAPVIAGTATEDQTLTADTSGIVDADGLGAFSQQWLRDGVAIAGATGSSLVLGDADVGGAFSVVVSYIDGHGTREQLTSAATAPVANVNDVPTGAPVIAGTAAEDQALTVDTSGIGDADGLGAFSYQWLRDGGAIIGATNAGLVLGDADVGRAISVMVSYTDGQGKAEQLTSAAMAPVANVNDAPTGAPVIAGTATEDQTLTVDTSGIGDADGLGAFSYQWLRDGGAIADATNGSLVLGDADVGRAISVVVSYTDGHGTRERLTSAATAPVANVNDAPTGAPVIVGVATEDQTLTVDTSGLGDADGLGAFSHQWLRDGVAISGATGSSLGLGDADVGRAISVVVSYTDGHGTREQLTSATTAPVVNVNDAPTGAPVIVGTATEDQTLTVDASGIGDTDGLGAFNYQWLRDGGAIIGATNGSLVLGDADVGRAISVVVSYPDGQGTIEQLTSAATAPVANVNDAPTGAPVIAGTATEDLTLSVDTRGIADPDGLGAFSYQWLRDGATITGATNNSLVLDDADVGRAISVMVSYTDGQGTAERLTSAVTVPVANVNDAPAGAQVIVGTATEDQTLTVDTSGIVDADGLGAFSQQWLRDGVAIAGATGSSLGLGDDDVGRAISVVVSYTDGHGTREQLTSATTAPVVNVNDAPTGAPVIVGTATEDQTLTVDASGIGDTDGLGAFNYQWLRDGGAIIGATNGSLVLGDADVGRAISVVVSYPDGQGTIEQLTSAATAPVANVNDAPTGAPVIAGTATEDLTLSVDTRGIADPDGLGAFSYQWLRDGATITGATNNSLVLGDADVGRAISVMVSYTDGQGTAERLTSAVTASVANVNDAPTGAPVIVGAATEDETLTVNTSDIVDADGLGAFSYQWLRDGAAITGATNGSLVLGDVDVGREISVVVSYTDGQGTAERKTSPATAPVGNVNDAPTGAPVIVGTATEDQTLRVDTSSVADADGLGAFSYQWLRDGVAIAGATNDSLVLGDADVGRAISVVVSYTDGHGMAEQLTSATTAPVTNVNDAPTGAAVIAGTTTEDQSLTVDTSHIVDADGLGAFSHQWLRDGAAIASATGSSLVLGDADVGRAISVVVSYTDGHGTREQLTSAATAPVANINDAPTGSPVIVGAATEDKTLTVDTSGIVDADGLGAFSYQWLRDGAAITGATNDSLVLGDADVGTRDQRHRARTPTGGAPPSG